MKRIWLFLSMVLGGMASAVSHGVAGDLLTIDLTEWKPPDTAAVGDDPFGKLVKYGHALFTNTPNEIGPGVADSAKRFAGNNLACQSCHLQGGTEFCGRATFFVTHNLCAQFPLRL
jgi:thiosulfate dehydrogenase